MKGKISLHFQEKAKDERLGGGHGGGGAVKELEMAKAIMALLAVSHVASSITASTPPTS